MSRARPSDADVGRTRRARRVALVMVATIVAWMGAQVLGGRLGLPVQMALVFDFAALAAFVWALSVTYQIWRVRRDS